ncbi:unnamed protein product, partial [Pylaiella littoralis]
LQAVENVLLTTAQDDFDGGVEAFEAAARWSAERLLEDGDGRAPHLACTEYENSREVFERLNAFLSPRAVRPASHSQRQGACFFATASHQEAATIQEQREAQFELIISFTIFPSALKLAPGLLQHGEEDDDDAEERMGRSEDMNAAAHGPDRLRARHGASMCRDTAEGLSVELTPGTLPAHAPGADGFMSALHRGLMSESLDLHSSNFWSHTTNKGGEHLATPAGALRGRDWSKAATVVHELSEAAGTSPGHICSWDSVAIYHPGNDVLLIAGLDHLLYTGMGAGGKGHDGEAAELHVACFMGLVSFFASRVEVMRVAPRHKVGLTNAAARANIQSATLTETPLTDAGLNGAGQVIQVVDSGLDESSCFFAHDATGDQVTHGYYFDDLGFNYDIFESWTTSATFGDNRATNKIFTFDDASVDGRHRIVQYINLIKPDNTPEELDASFTTRDGRKFPWLTAGEFENDKAAGHGTHVAGSAAGATLYTPAETIACENGKIIGCVGGCINQNASAGDLTDDDLVTTSEHAASHAFFDIDRLCSDFGCGEESNKLCLRNNVSETLTKSGGVAPGAKLAIFDAVFKHDFAGGFAGNGLWEACVEAGCRLHSNSYGSDNECMLTPSDILYDEFMYENPEHLLIFAAGNDGNKTRQDCTVNSPAIAKNVLAVGASTSGSTRISATSAAEPSKDTAGIDEIAYFSAYGFTKDGRIKPEVVAPGDSVYSAASDGEEDKYSCRLFAFAGTSMSCPIVAGAAAMIRQYFMDAQFYGADLKARGFCGDWDGCEGFVPSAATLKAKIFPPLG